MSAPSLYAHLLGAAFAQLAPALRTLHDARPAKHYAGRCEIRVGAGRLARLITRFAGLPATAADLPVQLTIVRMGAAEQWTRLFGAHRLQSRLSASAQRLEERMGPMVIAFDLAAESGRIQWSQHSARWAGLPMSWLISCAATESIEQGQYRFDASARLRGIGMLIHYRGWLVEHEP